MRVFAIISEYNPLHAGHIYQINRIKKQFPEAYIISFTSGSFVQRGEPSFISKHLKARLAVEHGVDLFIEMPSIISLQSANYFSKYSINLLNKLNIVTDLSFGVESLTKKDIEDYIIFLNRNKKAFDLSIRGYMKKGLSLKSAYRESLKDFNYPSYEKLLLPNNSLALRYSKDLFNLVNKLDIYPLDRAKYSYHEKDLSDKPFQSATALRRAIRDGIDVCAYLGYNKKILQGHIDLIGIDRFSEIFYYKALVCKDSPNEIAGYEEGLLNLLVSNFDGKISDMVKKSHNKRYSKSRISRFVFNYLLDIKKIDVDSLDQLNYIRPLAFNKRGSYLLGQVKNKSDVTIISKYSDIFKLDPYNQKVYGLEERAFKLYNTSNISNNILEFSNIPLVD